MPAPIHPPAHPETVFTYGAPQLKFGSGTADGTGAVGYTEDDVAGIFRRSPSLW